MSALDYVNTDDYPIASDDTAEHRALVERCQRAFVADGVVLLPNFLSGNGLEAIAAEAIPLVSKAYVCRNEHNVYLDDADPALSAAHPRNRALRTDVGSIANDYLAPSGALQQLYELQVLTNFIADVVGSDQMYRSDDPLGAVSINVFAPGDGHAWHFDESPFSVTLMVQPAEQGGHFEYVRGLRDEGDGDIEAIGAVLDGDATDTARMPFEPGTLSIFAGRHTMHRVSTVAGDRPRLVPVLTYSETPGYRNSDAVRAFFWGRVA